MVHKTICLSCADADLPSWFVLLMEKNGWKELNLQLGENEVAIREAADNMRAIYLEERGKKTAAAILCTILSEEVPVSDLLKVHGETVFPIPDSFSFLTRSIKGLDVCFSLVVPLGDRKYYAEQYVVCYGDDVEIIPEFLSLTCARLKILKQDTSLYAALTGSFRMEDFKDGEGRSFFISLEFLPGQIRGTLGAPEGKFPTLFEFLAWISKKAGGQAAEPFEWLEDSEKILKVSLEQASVSIDTSTGAVEDCTAAFLVSLWGFPFDLVFYGKDKMLRGSLRKGHPARLRELWEKIAAGTPLPAEAEDMELSECMAEVALDQKSCRLQCRIKNSCAIAGFSLDDIGLEICTGTATQLRIWGEMTVKGIWSCQVTLIYQDAEHYQVIGGLRLREPLELGNVPLLDSMFPGKMTWRSDGLALGYEKGRLTEASASFTYGKPQEEKPKLETRYCMEETSDGGLRLKEEQTAPEQGPLRQGDLIRWKPVRKTIGPVCLERVGMLFEDQKLWAALEAGMKIGPVEVQVLGFMAGYDLRAQSVCCRLNGLGLYCKTSAFSLSGMIRRDLDLPKDVRESYSGSLSIKMARWELACKGSYAVMEDGTDSLFVFLSCSLLLTVLPAFQITGIMGGIGIHRRLRLPKAEEVPQFPLLSSNGQEQKVLADLNQWITPAKGEYWAAAGIRFTACGLLEGKVLLSLLFGQEFQAALIGSAAVTLPKGAPREKAYASISILLSALLRPAYGSFYAEAVLGKESFLLDQNCHVFGQAACAVWFGRHEKAGDFVLSIGGYHPSYVPPAHYPKVNPVGFSWQISSSLSAKGSVYLAVTPACIMAGGNLELLFATGNLKAWFTAYVHLLMQWHPFYFDGQIGVELGVSYKLNLLFCHKTIKVTIGGQLHIWGPPLGGRLTVRLAFIKFTISFGKRAQAAEKAIDWKTMRETLLPGEKLHSVEALTGVRSQEKETEPWLSETGRFQIRCRTAVPTGKIHIRPMRIADASSEWKVTIVSPDKKSGGPEDFGLEIEKETALLPDALWGQVQENLSVPKEGLVRGCGGYLLRTKAPEFSGEIRIPDFREALIQCLILPNPLVEMAELEQPEIYGDETTDTIEKLKDIAQEAAIEKRGKIAAALTCYYTGSGGHFAQTQENRAHLYTDCPRYRKQVG